MTGVSIQPGWHIHGTWYEACASEGHCPLYFGRDMDAPCRNFAVYDIRDGRVNGIDVAGVRVIAVSDILSVRASEFATAAAIYVSDSVAAEQRPVLEAFVASCLPLPVSELRTVKFVPIELSDDGHSYHVAMPFGELRGTLTVGRDHENPQRIENSPPPFLRELMIANTDIWTYRDLGRNWVYRNRSGVVGELVWPPADYPHP